MKLLALATAFSLVVAFFVAWLVVVRPAQQNDDATVTAQQLVDGRASKEARVDGTAVVGQPMPATQVERLDASGVLDLGDYAAGRPMIVNFWASTCAPCRKEMPALEAAHSDHPDVAFVGIDVSDSVESGKKMLTDTKVTYPQGRDPASKVIAAFGGAALPHTVAVNGAGKVVAIHSGALDAEGVAALVAKAGAT